MTRVQIPTYTDHWMRGDRYGDLVSITQSRKWPHTKLAVVKLDKSGKTIRVAYDDCVID